MSTSGSPAWASSISPYSKPPIQDDQQPPDAKGRDHLRFPAATWSTLEAAVLRLDGGISISGFAASRCPVHIAPSAFGQLATRLADPLGRGSKSPGIRTMGGIEERRPLDGAAPQCAVGRLVS